MSNEEDASAFDVASGSFEEAQEWVGRSGDTFFAAEPINRSMIQFYASLVRDPNPTYWDEQFATEQWGGFCSPPGLLWTWKMDPQWTPTSRETEKEDVSVTDVPLPDDKNGIINTQSKTVFHRPLREGTLLNWQTEISHVSEQKDTRVGLGHFVTETTTYRAENGEPIAEESNVMLRYETSDDDASEDAGNEFDGEPFSDGRRVVEAQDRQPEERYTSLELDDISTGESIPGFEYPVTYERVIHNAAASRDFSKHHHDPEYTRAQGNETIFMNTMGLQGIVDRAALQWAGPEWRIAEREISMRGTAVAGDKLDVSASVTDVDEDGQTVELSVSLEKDGWGVCPSTVVIARDAQT